MKNQFIPYKLMNIHAISSGYIFHLDNVLVDIDNQQFIYCRYMLATEYDTNTSEVDCRIVKTPMKIIDNNTVSIDYNDFISKLNRKNLKKVDYWDLSAAFDVDDNKAGRFSVFM